MVNYYQIYLLFVAVRVVAVSDDDVAFEVVADFDIDRAAVKTLTHVYR